MVTDAGDEFGLAMRISSSNCPVDPSARYHVVYCAWAGVDPATVKARHTAAAKSLKFINNVPY
jgi:hypothetical protein